MSHTLIHNESKHQFEVHLNDSIAFAAYERFENGITYTHTEVPTEMSGQGVGSFIAKGILDYAKENNLQVKPECSFILSYIDKHPEYQDISVVHNKK
ncbi:N-acetyltransferase [Bizionia gelidisalsuginis]|uniref:N-acetyltransferase n=2 Tax=Bizionia TaxID=283785 RepID=A0A8H2LGI3_9FLAO|nr:MULTISPECIES: GNAT family N-acetyltransferase [Bizionia]TYB73827.1 N-acetyltransferase [Bizionia saleffrena]TYC12789.1 N-acetyltransferase [Bizionia gelidisalsuginis]